MNLKNILFVGGIHGVGKSTICKQLCVDLDVNYLSASDVLKWKDINIDKKNKKVTNIPGTQDRLIAGLNNVITPDNYYILDGHFCLFDANAIVTKIPFDTFKIINPLSLTVITGNLDDVLNGLQSRDQKSYTYESLSNMQKLEMEYAQELSDLLKVKLFKFSKADYSLNYTNILSQYHESIVRH